MSKFDKLIQRIKAVDPALRFDELRKVLEMYGYVGHSPGKGGSHYTFRKQGCMPITIPMHHPVGIAYIKLVKAVVEKENRNE